jgi:hypothetical protein
VAQGVAMLQHFMLSPMSQARDWFPLEPDPESAEAIKFATEAFPISPARHPPWAVSASLIVA